MRTDMFLNRHLGPNEEEIRKMLQKIDASSLTELLDETIPESIRLQKPLDLPEGISEYEFSKHINKLGKENKIFIVYHWIAITPETPFLKSSIPVSVGKICWIKRFHSVIGVAAT